MICVNKLIVLKDNVIYIAIFRDFITDEEVSEDEEDTAKRKEEDTMKSPVQSDACVPDYILLSGGM